MRFTLRLFLGGLVALVQEHDDRLHVLLLNAAHGHHAHFPILLCDPGNSACSLSAADQGAEIARQVGAGAPLSGYLLAGEEIALRGAAAGALAPIVGRWRRRWYHDFAGAVPADRRECADCGWIAPMRSVDAARSVVAARHLRGPRREEIAAKLTLASAQGLLRTFRVAEACGEVPSLTFKRPGAATPVRAFRQALADTAVLEIEAAQPVSFELSAFPTNGADVSAGAVRTLTVGPQGDAKVADVLLANMSPLPDRLPCGPGFVAPPALHFELFYRLAEAPMPSGEGMLPIPHPGGRKTPSARVNEPWPPIFKALGRAAGDAQGTIERPICTLVSLDPESLPGRPARRG